MSIEPVSPEPDGSDAPGSSEQVRARVPGQPVARPLEVAPAPPPTAVDETLLEELAAEPSNGDGATPRRAPVRDRHRDRQRARKVRRVVRHVDPWSVLKVSIAFYFCLWMIVTVAGFILWQVIVGTGTIGNIESFVAELTANESYDIDGGQILRASAIAGLILVFAGTALTVMMTVLFNFLSDLTGGIKVAVVEMETAEPSPNGQRAVLPPSPVSRPTAR